MSSSLARLNEIKQQLGNVVVSDDEMARLWALELKAKKQSISVWSRPLSWALNTYVERQAYWLWKEFDFEPEKAVEYYIEFGEKILEARTKKDREQ